MLVFVIDEKKNTDLKFIEFGKPYRSGERCWGPGVREYYMLHLIIEGEGYFNGTKLKAGDFFVTHPFERIRYYANPDNPWNYIWILLNGDKVTEFLSSYGFYSEKGYGSYDGVENVSHISNTIFAKDFIIVNNEMALNMAKLLFSFNNAQKETSGVKQKHLTKAIEFMDGKYHEGISPKNVADFVALSEKYLYSLFKAEKGISVQEYLNNLRIEKAKVLLEKSNLNISEIAYSIGIEDPLHFSRFFRQKNGCSPKQYRQKVLENKD